VGSRSSITRNATERAYIAGFLDGDGSVMLQIKKRGDSKRGWRFMATVCFYQDTRHEEPLHWIRNCFGIGYLSHRSDGMTELRINGYDQCERVLRALSPYIRFKRAQVDALLRAIATLRAQSVDTLRAADKRLLISCIETIQNQNYQSRRKRSKDQLEHILGLTP
jgi:hypothetical protein